MVEKNKTEQNKTALARSSIHLLVPESKAEKENPQQKVEAEKVLKYVGLIWLPLGRCRGRERK